MAWCDVNPNLSSWERSTPKAFLVKRYKDLGTQTLNACCKKCKNKTIIKSGKEIFLHKSDKQIKRFDFLCTLEVIDDLLEEKISLICKNCNAKRKLEILDFRKIGGKTKIETKK